MFKLEKLGMVEHFCVSDENIRFFKYFCFTDGQNANFEPRQATAITGGTTKEGYREEEDGKR